MDDALALIEAASFFALTVTLFGKKDIAESRK
jgi:hypothetical protein